MDLDTIQAACKQRQLAEILAKEEAAAAEAEALSKKNTHVRRPSIVREVPSVHSGFEVLDQVGNEEEGFVGRSKETDSSISGISENDSQMENRISQFGFHFPSDEHKQNKTNVEPTKTLATEEIEITSKTQQLKFNTSKKRISDEEKQAKQSKVKQSDTSSSNSTTTTSENDSIPLRGTVSFIVFSVVISFSRRFLFSF